MDIILAGGTGFIGKALTDALVKAGHHVTLFTRSTKNVHVGNSLNALVWDAKTSGDWTEAFNRSDAVINLSGASIAAGRWTAAQKKKIKDSRIDSTRVLVEAVKRANKKPSVFINASAVGYYGNVPEGKVDENHAKGSGFLAGVCAAWEAEAQRAGALGVRTVLMRTGIVLERGGGALSKMTLPFMMFAGGPLGSGRQWFPWIHRDDVVGLILFALNHGELSGAVNAVSPNPLTMFEFCKVFGRVLGRPSWAPVPVFMLKLLLGEMSSLLLEGQKAVPEKLLKHGYAFKYPTAEAALNAIFK